MVYFHQMTVLGEHPSAGFWGLWRFKYHMTPTSTHVWILDPQLAVLFGKVVTKWGLTERKRLLRVGLRVW